MARTIKVKISREMIPDDYPDLSWLEQDYSDESPEDCAKYKAQDAERLAAYLRGDWYMVGIRAKAELEIPYGPDIKGASYILQEIKSPGLWGIESDSEESYFNEVFEDEKATLLAMLNAFKESELEIVKGEE